MRFNTYGHSLGLRQELTRFKTFPLCRQLYRKTRLRKTRIMRVSLNLVFRYNCVQGGKV